MTIANTIFELKTQASCGFPLTHNWKAIVANALRNGLNVSNYTNNRIALSASLRSIALVVFLLTSSVLAQEDSLQFRIDSASTALSELDDKAQSCLDSVEQENREQAVSACDEFLQAVDGSLLANYISHCEVLKDWRENFITSANANANAADAELNVRLLSGIEFTCGEDALQKRTEYVFRAFNLLQGASSQSQIVSTIDRRFSEFEQEQLRRSQEQLLRNGLDQQRQRRSLDTSQQWDDLQEELIRQQINRPPFPGN